MSGVVTHLDATHPQFPSTGCALREPNGLLAVGGNFRAETLLRAYRSGIFPWSGPEEPIMWWSPDPRAVIFTDRVHLPRSLRRDLRKNRYRITMDNAFERVVRACANRPRTWIRPDLIDGFCELHELGYSHSVEVWEGQTLVGGLYGIATGTYFSGESMFSRRTNVSKIALACLAQQLLRWGFPIIDCQQPSRHLQLLGAELIARDKFMEYLDDCHAREQPPRRWTSQLAVPYETQ